MSKPRLPKGYARVDTFGDIIQFDIFVEKKSGSYAIQSHELNSNLIGCESLQDAKSKIRLYQKVDMFKATLIKNEWSDGFYYTIEHNIRKVGDEYFNDRGYCFDSSAILVASDDPKLVEIEALRTTYEHYKQLARDTKEEATQLISSMKRVNV